MQDRLQHLENLVMSLAQKQRPAEQVSDLNHSSGNGNYNTPPSASERENKSPPQDAGTLVMSAEGTSYIDSANWRAILEEVCLPFGDYS